MSRSCVNLVGACLHTESKVPSPSGLTGEGQTRPTAQNIDFLASALLGLLHITQHGPHFGTCRWQPTFQSV